MGIELPPWKLYANRHFLNGKLVRTSYGVEISNEGYSPINVCIDFSMQEIAKEIGRLSLHQRVINYRVSEIHRDLEGRCVILKDGLTPSELRTLAKILSSKK